MKLIYFIFLLITIFGCGKSLTEQSKNKIISIENSEQISISNSADANSDEKENIFESEYEGKTIDQIFPPISYQNFTDEKLKGNLYSVNIDEFKVLSKDFTPQKIEYDGKAIFQYKTLYSKDYWANLVGISHLLGENSKQIYIEASGPGGVCCTNYWITDISGGKPKNIYRSEDFGSFRDPMEIFDADEDGIYEIVQFDSAFRYFMGDCGACSPEPRAVFKYNKKAEQYLPASGLQQDFVKKSFEEAGNKLVDEFEILKMSEDIGARINFDQKALAYIVDLFYLGKEKSAWRFFNKYFADYGEKENIRAEIKKRLRYSKFYQALKKTE